MIDWKSFTMSLFFEMFCVEGKEVKNDYNTCYLQYVVLANVRCTTMRTFEFEQLSKINMK